MGVCTDAPTGAVGLDEDAGAEDLGEDAGIGEDVDEDEDLRQLTELALSASSDATLDAGALPLLLSPSGARGLPEWYMPAVAVRHCGGTKRAVIVSIVLVLLLLEALGLCSVFGQVVIG
ncbi:MAG TPA: hypothetical protein VMD59_10510 [Acidimicrobiales bacterium]|nr:hypothetical protein [Acidimicrobiales bacterium]